MKLYSLFLAAFVILFAAITYSQNPIVPVDKANLPIINWQVQPGEEVKIENGNGANLMVQITVQGVSENSPGIVIKNCGKTTTLKAGSSAICTTSDANSPVTFTTDDNTEPAKGTYQIKQGA